MIHFIEMQATGLISR